MVVMVKTHGKGREWMYRQERIQDSSARRGESDDTLTPEDLKKSHIAKGKKNK